METKQTTYLKNIYAKRLCILRQRWNALMQEQDTLSHDEIISDSFQAKRKRIGNLYSRLQKIINEPTSKALRAMLTSVHQNRFKLPTGIITYNIQ
ncbi:hypothetical protein [uncultured Winogradskyella sp.]|uniref:hypothetical protein n=1 Tax=uncultured Winogradskyella sp. TaxID=395353 RepID=UPI00261A54AF|nr:hypothetical protein [uncultured Winogradskyella sp.]